MKMFASEATTELLTASLESLQTPLIKRNRAQVFLALLF
jgi:hypothetical protein